MSRNKVAMVSAIEPEVVKLIDDEARSSKVALKKVEPKHGLDQLRDVLLNGADEVFKGNIESAKKEMVKLAALAARFVQEN